MKSDAFLITMSSWEPRFELAVRHICSKESLCGTLVFSSREYLERTRISVAKVRDLLEKNSVDMSENEVDFIDQIATYTVVENSIKNASLHGAKRLLIDISTMPREIVWITLKIARDVHTEVEFIYFPPESYHQTWLTRDPNVPRLTLRNSGISKYGLPTALVIVTGFDPDRTLKAINFFEPSKVLLGIQVGEQYENNRRNVDKQRCFLKPQLSNIDIFEIDAYAADFGFNCLKSVCSGLLKDHNVLLTSQGPKPSSIAAFAVATAIPAIGLYYLPALEYNLDYSTGIRIEDTVRGKIPS